MMRKSTTQLLQLKTSKRSTHTSLSTKKKISIRQPMRVKPSLNLPPQANSDSKMTKITLPMTTSLSSHPSNILTLYMLLVTPTKDTSSNPQIQGATFTMRSPLRSPKPTTKSTLPRFIQAMMSPRRRRSRSLKKNLSTTLPTLRKTTRRILYSPI
jgi:hypothetical protein